MGNAWGKVKRPWCKGCTPPIPTNLSPGGKIEGVQGLGRTPERVTHGWGARQKHFAPCAGEWWSEGKKHKMRMGNHGTWKNLEFLKKLPPVERPPGSFHYSPNLADSVG